MEENQKSFLDTAPSWREMARADRGGRRLLGVQGRLMLVMSAVLFAALASSAHFVARDIGESARRRIHDDAQTLAISLAQGSHDALARLEAPSLAAAAQAMAADGRFSSVEFRDGAGNLIASNRIAAVAKATSAVEPFKGSDVRVSQRADASAGEVVDAEAPIFARDLDTGLPTGASLGSVRVTARLSVAEERVVSVLQTFSAITCIVVISALVLSALLVRSIFSPVRELIKATKKVMAGDLNVRMLASSPDAFGELAHTFNELVQWVRQHRADLAEANTKLAAANHELATKIEARTTQLEAANQRLAGEIAEKEDFLRAVSHDLNAPLRNIGGMVAMLMLKNREHLPAEAIQRLERIKKNVEVETDLINELLELSRIKTRRGKLELLETERLVWDLRGLFENDLKTRHIELIIDSTLPNLLVEKARLRQVFQNLVDNAIKYMGERATREIHVGCRLGPAEAEFYVRDTGTGIHPEDIDKVFFIFRRGRSEQTQKTAGKGIGLASVKSIIETYSGKIWVTSEQNVGTTFHFTINGRFVPSVSGQSIEQLQNEDRNEEEPADLKAAA